MIDLAAFRHPQHGDAMEGYGYDRTDGVACIQAKYRHGTAVTKTCAWWVQGTDGGWYVSHGDVKLDRLKPYHWSQLDNPRSQHLPIIVCEGPKDADALAALGFICTDGKALVAEHASWFAGRDVVVVQDRDPPSSATTGGGYGLAPSKQTPGERYARKAANIIQPVAQRVAMFTFPGDGIKDATDWVTSHPGRPEDKNRILTALFRQALDQSEGIVEPEPETAPGNTVGRWAAGAAEPDEAPAGPATEAAAAEPDAAPMLLPEELWQARPWLTELRRYAWSRRLDADLLLGVVLARYSALLPGGTSFDSGVHSDRASPNLFVAGIGHSGAGKSGGLRAGEKIVPSPVLLNSAEGPLGSGQGISEAYMGEVELPLEPGAKGKPKIVRQQVRANVFMHLDEAEALFRIAAQATNTTMQTLRTAFVGNTLGDMNADKERRRSVTDYHFGLFLGFQPTTAGKLLADVLGGTPQRFLFLRAGPRPKEGPGWAPLPVLSLPHTFIPVAFPPHLKAEVIRLLDEHDDAVVDTTEPDWESHTTLLRCKLATLFCATDGGRQQASDDDWRLAGILTDTSRRVRDWLRGVAEKQAAAEKQERLSERAEGAALSTLASRGAEERVEKLARALARKVHDAGTVGRRDAINRTIREPLRYLTQAVVDFAVERQWIVDAGRHFRPGSAIP